jgi:hypothetical protein
MAFFDKNRLVCQGKLYMIVQKFSIGDYIQEVEVIHVIFGRIVIAPYFRKNVYGTYTVSSWP